jgi:hypothetical protein
MSQTTIQPDTRRGQTPAGLDADQRAKTPDTAVSRKDEWGLAAVLVGKFSMGQNGISALQYFCHFLRFGPKSQLTNDSILLYYNGAC